MGDKTGHYGRETKSIGGGQKMLMDSGPDRGEPMQNMNPSMKKGGETMTDTGLSRTISSGKVPDIGNQ